MSYHIEIRLMELETRDVIASAFCVTESNFTCAVNDAGKRLLDKLVTRGLTTK